MAKCMLKSGCVIGVKTLMCWIQIKMGHSLAQNGALLAPFCANRTHPSVCSDTELASLTNYCTLLLPRVDYSGLHKSVQARSAVNCSQNCS